MIFGNCIIVCVNTNLKNIHFRGGAKRMLKCDLLDDTKAETGWKTGSFVSIAKLQDAKNSFILFYYI